MTSMLHAPYPDRSSEQNRWILARRGPRNVLDSGKPYAFFFEEEIGQDGSMVPTATILLTNTECPFRCVMCDLWQNTLTEPTPRGAIPAQIDYALRSLPPVRQVKLYNAGSFFDPRAIPADDDEEIIARVARFDRVIVECHPAFIGERCAQFAGSMTGKLEVAIGLETVHPEVLNRLNKRMDIEDFRRSADFLKDNGMDLRVFLLVRPPWMNEAEGLEWACRSLVEAFGAGATACTLIPTRAGNGAMEALAESGAYAPPDLRSVELSQEYGLRLGLGRVFSDTWDIEKFYRCECSPLRSARLELMNREQRIPESTVCPKCS